MTHIQNQPVGWDLTASASQTELHCLMQRFPAPESRELSPNPDADQSNSRTHNHKEATLSGGQLTQSWSHPVTQSGLMYPQPHQIQPHHNHPLLTPSNTATSGNAFGGAWDNETSVAALRQSFSTPGPQQLTPPGVNIPQSVVWHYQPPHHPPHAHSAVSGSRSAAPPCGMPASWGSIDHVRLGPSSASLPTPTPQNAIVPHQSFESKNDALSTSHIQAARPPPQALNPANPAPSGVSSQGPDISRLLATSLPSADEKVLQGKVSELRVALQQTHTRAESATREVHNMWSKLQQSEQASSQYQARVYDLEKALELARAQLHGQMGGIGFAMGHDAAQMIDIVRGPQLTGAMAEVARLNEAVRLAESRHESAQHALVTLQREAEAAAAASKQECDRLALEAAECRLLNQARSRQLDSLKVEANELRTRAEQAEAQHSETLQKLDQMQTEFETHTSAIQESCTALEKRAQIAEQDAVQTSSKLASVTQSCEDAEKLLLETQQHTQWLEGRIQDMESQDSSSTASHYDAELRRLREALGQEKQQLEEQLQHERARRLAAESELRERQSSGATLAPPASACDAGSAAEEYAARLMVVEQRAQAELHATESRWRRRVEELERALAEASARVTEGIPTAPLAASPAAVAQSPTGGAVEDAGQRRSAEQMEWDMLLETGGDEELDTGRGPASREEPAEDAQGSSGAEGGRGDQRESLLEAAREEIEQLRALNEQLLSQQSQLMKGREEAEEEVLRGREAEAAATERRVREAVSAATEKAASAEKRHTEEALARCNSAWAGKAATLEQTNAERLQEVELLRSRLQAAENHASAVEAELRSTRGEVDSVRLEMEMEAAKQVMDAQAEMQSAAEAATSALVAELTGAAETAAAAARAELSAKQEQCEAAASRLAEEQRKREALEQEMASQLTALGDEQASKVSAMEQAHLCELERAISAAAEELATAVRSARDEAAQQHSLEMSEALAAKEEVMEAALQDAVASAVELAQQTVRTQMSNEATTSLLEAEQAHVAQLAQLQATWDEKLRDAEQETVAEWESKLADAQSEAHQHTLEAMRASQDVTHKQWEVRLAEVQSLAELQYQQTLQEALEESLKERELAVSELSQQHQEALAACRSDVAREWQEGMDEALEAAKQQHAQAAALSLATVSCEWEAKLAKQVWAQKEESEKAWRAKLSEDVESARVHLDAQWGTRLASELEAAREEHAAALGQAALAAEAAEARRGEAERMLEGTAEEARALEARLRSELDNKVEEAYEQARREADEELQEARDAACREWEARLGELESLAKQQCQAEVAAAASQWEAALATAVATTESEWQARLDSATAAQELTREEALAAARAEFAADLDAQLVAAREAADSAWGGRTAEQLAEQAAQWESRVLEATQAARTESDTAWAERLASEAASTVQQWEARLSETEHKWATRLEEARVDDGVEWETRLAKAQAETELEWEARLEAQRAEVQANWERKVADAKASADAEWRVKLEATLLEAKDANTGEWQSKLGQVRTADAAAWEAKLSAELAAADADWETRLAEALDEADAEWEDRLSTALATAEEERARQAEEALCSRDEQWKTKLDAALAESEARWRDVVTESAAAATAERETQLAEAAEEADRSWGAKLAEARAEMEGESRAALEAARRQAGAELEAARLEEAEAVRGESAREWEARMATAQEQTTHRWALRLAEAEAKAAAQWEAKMAEADARAKDAWQSELERAEQETVAEWQAKLLEMQRANDEHATEQVSKAHVASWEEAEAVWQARMQEAVEEAQRESQERIADAQKEHRDVLERTAAQMREEWAEQEQRALTAQQREMALEKEEMLAQFEAQVESLKEAARSELTAAMSDAEREHSALTEQFEAAQQNLKQNHKQISAADEKIAALSAAYEASKLEHAEALQAFKSSFESEQTNHLATVQLAVDQRQAELEARSAELEEQRADLESSGAETRRLESSLRARASELEAQSSQLEQRQADVATQRAQVVGVRRELEAQKAVIARRSAELDALQQELESEKSKMAQHQHNAAVQGEVERQNEELRARTAELTVMSEELKQRHKALTHRASELESTSQSLERENEGLVAQRQELQHRMSGLEGQVAHLKHEIRLAHTQTHAMLAGALQGGGGMQGVTATTRTTTTRASMHSEFVTATNWTTSEAQSSAGISTQLQFHNGTRDAHSAQDARHRLHPYQRIKAPSNVDTNTDPKGSSAMSGLPAPSVPSPTSSHHHRAHAQDPGPSPARRNADSSMVTLNGHHNIPADSGASTVSGVTETSWRAASANTSAIQATPLPHMCGGVADQGVARNLWPAAKQDQHASFLVAPESAGSCYGGNATPKGDMSACNMQHESTKWKQVMDAREHTKQESARERAVPAQPDSEANPAFDLLSTTEEDMADDIEASDPDLQILEVGVSGGQHLSSAECVPMHKHNDARWSANSIPRDEDDDLCRLEGDNGMSPTPPHMRAQAHSHTYQSQGKSTHLQRLSLRQSSLQQSISFQASGNFPDAVTEPATLDDVVDVQDRSLSALGTSQQMPVSSPTLAPSWGVRCSSMPHVSSTAERTLAMQDRKSVRTGGRGGTTIEEEDIINHTAPECSPDRTRNVSVSRRDSADVAGQMRRMRDSSELSVSVRSSVETTEEAHKIIDIMDALRVSRNVRQVALLQEAVARQHADKANRASKTFIARQSQSISMSSHSGYSPSTATTSMSIACPPGNDDEEVDWNPSARQREKPSNTAGVPVAPVRLNYRYQ